MTQRKHPRISAPEEAEALEASPKRRAGNTDDNHARKAGEDAASSEPGYGRYFLYGALTCLTIAFLGNCAGLGG